jgi:hypothetical protein
MQAVSQLLKRLIQVAAISAAVAVLSMAAMFAFNMLVFEQGQAGVRATLQRAIDDGSINMTGRVAPWSLLPLAQRPGWPMYMHECLQGAEPEDGGRSRGREGHRQACACEF